MMKRSKKQDNAHFQHGWDVTNTRTSHAMCASNECDSRDRTKTKKIENNYAHNHVFMLCFVLMLLWILVFTLSLVSDVSPFSKKVLYVNCTHTQYQV